MKKLFALLLVLTLAFSLFAACGSDNSNTAKTSNEGQESKETVKSDAGDFDAYPRPKVTTDDKIQVAFVCSQPTFDYNQRCVNQAKVEGTGRNWDVDVQYYEDEQGMRTILKSLINRGVDAIVVNAVSDMPALQDIVKEAREAGIGWYNADCELVDGVISNVGSNNARHAIDLFYNVMDREGWSENFIIMGIAGLQQHIIRSGVVEGAVEGYTTVNCYEYVEIADTSSMNDDGYDACKALIQKYDVGTELTGMFTLGDNFGIVCAEALAAAGYAPEECWTTGMDGGGDAFAYIRNDTAFKYCQVQAVELALHQTFEIIDQIQIQGLNPGDQGCDVPYAGAMIYTSTELASALNAPEGGENINKMFSYYTDDPDAWYNWEGSYTISEG